MDDKDSAQVAQVVSLPLPSLKIFRHGGMYDYSGPIANPQSIAEALKEAARPAVSMLVDVEEVKALVRTAKASSSNSNSNSNSNNIDMVVLGYFSQTGRGQPWEAFVEAAERLRG